MSDGTNALVQGINTAATAIAGAKQQYDQQKQLIIQQAAKRFQDLQSQANKDLDLAAKFVDINPEFAQELFNSGRKGKYAAKTGNLEGFEELPLDNYSQKFLKSLDLLSKQNLSPSEIAEKREQLILSFENITLKQAQEAQKFIGSLQQEERASAKEQREALQFQQEQEFGTGQPQEFTIGGETVLGRITPAGKVVPLTKELKPGEAVSRTKEGPIRLTEQQFKRTKDLRDEFVKRSTDYFKVRDSFQRVRESAKDPSAAGDLALIFNYMKILDPGSVVRESEFANAQNAAGVPERIRAKYNSIINGQRLSEKQRNDFVDRAKRLFEPMQTQHDKRVQTFGQLAKDQDLPKNQVVIDLGLVEESTEMQNKTTIPLNKITIKTDMSTLSDEQLRAIAEGRF